MMLLRVSGVSVELGGARVLDDVSLDVAPGELVGLIGVNGAGKSTLLRAAQGLVSRTSGRVELAGRALETIDAMEPARTLAYLPQEREVAWAVSVETLVALGRDMLRPRFAPASAEDGAAIEDAMRRMDVLHLRHRPATALSGGERARVLIARLLAQATPLLLADEPVAGLDPAHQIALMRLFRDLAGQGRGVVATLHDLGLAARWCTRLVLLDGGRILADGTPGEVLTDERIRAVYGVTVHRVDRPDGLIVHPLDIAKP